MKLQFFVGVEFIDWHKIEREAIKAFCENPQIPHRGLPETYRGRVITAPDYVTNFAPGAINYRPY